MSDIRFSSKYDNWETPDWLFNQLDKEFHFDLDPCSSESNHKCDNYFTQKEDGLLQDWSKYESIFMNPPYGKRIGDWVQKAGATSYTGITVVCLLPVRSDTAWWHEYVIGNEILFIKGRLKFNHPKNNNGHNSTFASCIVIMRGCITDNYKTFKRE